MAINWIVRNIRNIQLSFHLKKYAHVSRFDRTQALGLKLRIQELAISILARTRKARKNTILEKALRVLHPGVMITADRIGLMVQLKNVVSALDADELNHLFLGIAKNDSMQVSFGDFGTKLSAGQKIEVLRVAVNCRACDFAVSFCKELYRTDLEDIENVRDFAALSYDLMGTVGDEVEVADEILTFLSTKLKKQVAYEFIDSNEPQHLKLLILAAKPKLVVDRERIISSAIKLASNANRWQKGPILDLIYKALGKSGYRDAILRRIDKKPNAAALLYSHVYSRDLDVQEVLGRDDLPTAFLERISGRYKGFSNRRTEPPAYRLYRLAYKKDGGRLEQFAKLQGYSDATRAEGIAKLKEEWKKESTRRLSIAFMGAKASRTEASSRDPLQGVEFREKVGLSKEQKATLEKYHGPIDFKVEIEKLLLTEHSQQTEDALIALIYMMSEEREDYRDRLQEIKDSFFNVLDTFIDETLAS